MKLRRARAESAVLRTMPPDSLVSTTRLHDAMAVLYPDTSAIFGTADTRPSWLTRSAAIQRLRTSQTTEAKADVLVSFSARPSAMSRRFSSCFSRCSPSC